MVFNLSTSGLCDNFFVYDKEECVATNVANVVSKSSSSNTIKVSTIDEISKKCNIIFSMLPNDSIIKAISSELLENGTVNKFIHVSCSTISPTTSRALAVQIYKFSPIFNWMDFVCFKFV